MFTLKREEGVWYFGILGMQPQGYESLEEIMKEVEFMYSNNPN